MGGGRDDGSSSEAVIKLARKRQSMMCQRIHPHGFVLTDYIDDGPPKLLPECKSDWHMHRVI